MGSTSRLRLRRSAAQLHALAQIEREIRATDPHGRRKYLREFTDSFQTYEKVLGDLEYEQALLTADVLLVGDYHALPRTQEYAASLVEHLAQTTGRPIILGVETLFSRDQRIVDEWQRGDIDEKELRERLRFDYEWGYAWAPFYKLLETARTNGAKIFGLDAMVRGDLRRIAQRDRHAAEKLAEIHLEHPEALFVVLFGESHLAPQHLPALVRQAVPRFQVLTVLQNIDSLYWKAAGEPSTVKAVRIDSSAICVFNATPLEKYESYRLCIERWRQERRRETDFAPSFHNLISALAASLGLRASASTSTPQLAYLYDIIPEVYCRNNVEALRKIMERRRATTSEIRSAMDRVQTGGAAYVQRLNIILATRFDLESAGEEVARFLHAACRGDVGVAEAASVNIEQNFYSEALRVMAAYVGSRILHPAREAWREVDLYSRYSDTRERVSNTMHCNYGEYMRMIDFLVLHKDFECNARRYRHVPALIAEGRAFTGDRFQFVTNWLGRLLGTQVYDAYVSGRVHNRYLRSILSKRLQRPDEAKAVYFAIARRTRNLKPGWVS